MAQDMRLLTIKEAGKKMRVSPATLFRLMRAGQLAAVKIGRRTLLAAEDIQALVERNRQSRRVPPSLPSQDEKERALNTLRKAGLLAEPTPEMRHAAEAYDACHSPAAQKRLLAELRSLRLKPSLSETILQNRA